MNTVKQILINAVLIPLVIGLFVATTLIFVTNFITDFHEYQSIMEGTYETPWYNQSWFREPYTNFRLSQYPSAFHLATNGDQSQIWIEKEKKVGYKIFWTIDYRIPMTNYMTYITHNGDPF
jgi:hypothetical protein